MALAGRPQAGLSVAGIRIDATRVGARLSLGSFVRPFPIIITAALLLRILPWLAGYPLHHDEALYGAWARSIATGQDPFLLIPWVDKPPLVLYTLAASLRAFGISELALRLPGVVAGVALAGATYGFARRTLGDTAALVAAALLALSPFAILFAPTAFTDGWLALWLVAAAWAAVTGRPFIAGLLLGLAIGSKQQGVLGAPLVVALIALQVAGGGGTRRLPRLLGALGLGILGCALVVGPITWWDSLRWQNRPSFWDRSLQTYGGLVLAPAAQWPARAVQWAQQYASMFGPAWLSWPALVVAIGSGVTAGRRLIQRRPTPGDPAMVLLAGYVLGYLALHIVFTFQAWDRYLLPVLPLLCVLIASQARNPLVFSASPILRNRVSSRNLVSFRTRLFAVALAAVVIFSCVWGLSGRMPGNAIFAAYDGVDTAAAYIRAQPSDAVVYYRRLGWHLDYYLFDAPQERRWYGDGAKLASDADSTARRQPGRAQWLIMPGWEEDSLAEMQAALGHNGLALVEAARVPGRAGVPAVTLYRIAP